MALITYADKQPLGEQPSIPEVNKVTADNMNEIKNGVNSLETSVDVLETKTTLKYCVATTNSASTISANFYVPINTITQNEGGFTIQDGGIKIPAGVTRIRTSGSVFIDEWVGGNAYLWGKIVRWRGNSELGICNSIASGSSSYLSASIPSSVIDVQENDIIKLMADSGSGGKIRPYTDSTWICIEKVE